jgi:cullin-associated NEDD8-dissociated protein 1
MVSRSERWALPLTWLDLNTLTTPQSAYETLHVLMETAFNRMNTLDLFDRVIAGLFDDHDIKLLCMLMLSKLIILDRDECSHRLDFIAAAFQTGLSTKLKENAVKQEVEKLAECNNDILRTTVRLHNAFQKVETSGHAQWNSYWEWVVKDFKNGVHNAEEEVRKEQLQQ